MTSILRATLGATVLLATDAARLPTFDSFLQAHGRTYEHGSAEFQQRRSLYEERVAKAEVQNGKSDGIWVAGVNKLWDWTDSELQSLRGWDGNVRPEGGSGHVIRSHAQFLQQHPKDLPEEKMWMNLTATKHITDQGACGSCWAVSAATVLELNHEIYRGKFRSFSAQQITSCTPNPKRCGGDGGCAGATGELAMEWVLKNGCAEESAVPYEGKDTKCTAQGAHSSAVAFPQTPHSPHSPPAPVATRTVGGAAFGMTGWETLPKNQYEALARALVERGPAVVSVAASEWHYYSSGVFDGCAKDATVDHAVTAIGYGVDITHHKMIAHKFSVKYWEIQNSWGREWGEDGHIRIKRHDTESYCGTNYHPEMGIACKGDTKPVPVCGMCGVLFDSVVPHFS